MNGGDNHNGQPDRFRRYMELAKQNGGTFNLAASNALFAENAAITLANNAQEYYQAFIVVVFLGEYPFLPNVFSNGTYAVPLLAILLAFSTTT
jgi:ethanolamine ammonia-lyase small subunit